MTLSPSSKDSFDAIPAGTVEDRLLVRERTPLQLLNSVELMAKITLSTIFTDGVAVSFRSTVSFYTGVQIRWSFRYDCRDYQSCSTTELIRVASSDIMSTLKIHE